jgi:P-type conjugative transfer ATPase TrbB
MNTHSALPAAEERDLRVRDKLRREMGGMIFDCLAEETMIEIMLNPDGVLWVERIGQPMERLGLMQASQAEAFINTVAATRHTTITRENPILECDLPFGGHRFEALMPPVVGGPSFTIRVRPRKIFTLAEYVEAEIMTAAQMQYICRAVDERLNILVVGGTGSGKTTLVNGIIHQMSAACPDDRLVIIEDTPEIQCASPNKVIKRTSPEVNINRLMRSAMRYRPDRIIIGEVRGGEALELIKGWNTGHPGGAATIHANDALSGLVRLENLLAEATNAPMQKTIAAAVNLIAVIARTARRTSQPDAPAKRKDPGRRLQELLLVHGFEDGNYLTSPMEEACAPC